MVAAPGLELVLETYTRYRHGASRPVSSKATSAVSARNVAGREANVSMARLRGLLSNGDGNWPGANKSRSRCLLSQLFLEAELCPVHGPVETDRGEPGLDQV